MPELNCKTAGAISSLAPLSMHDMGILVCHYPSKPRLLYTRDCIEWQRCAMVQCQSEMTDSPQRQQYKETVREPNMVTRWDFAKTREKRVIRESI